VGRAPLFVLTVHPARRDLSQVWVAPQRGERLERAGASDSQGSKTSASVAVGLASSRKDAKSQRGSFGVGRAPLFVVTVHPARRDLSQVRVAPQRGEGLERAGVSDSQGSETGASVAVGFGSSRRAAEPQRGFFRAQRPAIAIFWLAHNHLEEYLSSRGSPSPFMERGLGGEVSSVSPNTQT
jgi:hypothetical protein